MIYTPTEGDAIQNYSRLFRKPEGCFLNINDQDRIEESLSSFGIGDDIDYIVVSDGEEVSFESTQVSLNQGCSNYDTLDPRYRRPGRWCHSHLGRKTCHHHALCWDSPITPTTGCFRLWNRCMFGSYQHSIR